MSQKNTTSRTGLSVSPRKIHLHNKRASLEASLAQCTITKPIQYSQRPFATLYNPFARNCSILCNHPGPNNIKQVVKASRDNGDTKNVASEEFVHICSNTGSCEILSSNHVDNLPDECFRHYAGSDSRPLTPTPTVISNRTRVSNTGSYLMTSRRCHTPDPITAHANERKQLVLDLRRSHSQETIYCNQPSELSFQTGDGSSAVPISNLSMATSPPPLPKNIRLCEQEARKRSVERIALQQFKEPEVVPSTVQCINDRDDVDDDMDAIRRRGKKKRRGHEMSTFRVTQEPETQITNVEVCDSPGASARVAVNVVKEKSITPNACSKFTELSRDSHYLHSNFITEDALKILRRGLEVDIVECAFYKFVRCLGFTFQFIHRTS